MHVITNHVLVEEPVLKEQKNEIGLYIPEEEKKWGQTTSGKVTSVGPDVKGVNVGDKIYYMAKAGETIKTDDIIYRVMQDNEVLAVED